MADFLDQKIQEINDRLNTLRPLVDEYAQLEAARQSLDQNGAMLFGSAKPRRRRSASSSTKRETPGRRAPRGANREKILNIIRERPGVSTGEVASATGIAKPTVYSTITRLKRDGVVASEDGGLKIAPHATLPA